MNSLASAGFFVSFAAAMLRFAFDRHERVLRGLAREGNHVELRPYRRVDGEDAGHSGATDDHHPGLLACRLDVKLPIDSPAAPGEKHPAALARAIVPIVFCHALEPANVDLFANRRCSHLGSVETPIEAFVAYSQDAAAAGPPAGRRSGSYLPP